MVQLAQWQEQFAAMGVNVAGMTYDDRAVLKTFHDEQGLDYPLLQDVDATHVKAFEVLNTDYEPGHRGYGIPFPGILLIEPDGRVALKFAVPGYRQRPPFEQILSAVEDLQGGAADADP